MKKVAMVVFSYYPSDPRPRREAEALIQQGFAVDIICLKDQNETPHEIVNGVSVYRQPLRRTRTSKRHYILQYLLFILIAFFKLTLLHIKKHYHIIHIHNMPDILVLSGLLPKLMSAKVVLDLHDPMPEVYVTKFKIEYSHPMIRTLILLERFSIWFADCVLTPNLSFQKLFIARGCPQDKIHIVMNSPQETVFTNKTTAAKSYQPSHDNAFNLMYHGTIVERHGLEVALGALKLLQNKISGLKFHVYGEGDFTDRFLKMTADLGLQDIVFYHGHVSLERIAAAIQTIDVGIIPNKKTVFTELNLPTRIFEYLSMAKPVIVPHTQGILDYFDENSIFYFNPDNAQNLAATIFNVFQDQAGRENIVKRGIDVYQRYRWELQKQHFVDIINNCIKN